MRKILFFLVMLILLSACSTQTIVTDEAVFVGEGKYWNAKYTYNANLYEEKYVNWAEIALIDEGESDINLNDIDLIFKSKDSTMTGNLGDMETQVNNNTITFLVGTVNFETHIEDIYELTINFNNKQDVIKLKALN